jgi:hypothetical protein
MIWFYRSIVVASMPSLSDDRFHWILLSAAMAGLLGPSLLAWLLEVSCGARAA